MSLYHFVDFMYVFIFIFSLLLSVLWIYSKKGNPYVGWFDKILVLIFTPLVFLTTFSFILMGIGFVFN